MVIGVVLGLVLAVMRLSPNPVVKCGRLGLPLDLPRDPGLRAAGVLGPVLADLPEDLPRRAVGPSVVHFDLGFMQNAFIIAVIGLALNEAAYMAEIVRAGSLSVDEGQEEAATALGMSWGRR